MGTWEEENPFGQCPDDSRLALNWIQSTAAILAAKYPETHGQARCMPSEMLKKPRRL